MAAVRWSPSEPLKIWVGLTGLARPPVCSASRFASDRALLVSLHERAARLEFERDQEGRLGRRRRASPHRARDARHRRAQPQRDDRSRRRRRLRDGHLAAARGGSDRSESPRPAVRRWWRCAGCSACCARTSAAQPLEPQPRLDRLDELLAQVQRRRYPRDDRPRRRSARARRRRPADRLPCRPGGV